MSTVYSRLGAIDELAVCILRAVRNGKDMPVINESNLIATCDHIANLIGELRQQVSLARSEL